MSSSPAGTPGEAATTLPGQGRRLLMSTMERAPCWVLVLLVGGLFALLGILRSPVYVETYNFLAPGILITLELAVSAYALAMVLGLIAAFGQLSRNPIFYTPARLYVEVVRGVPLLVQLLYIAFVLTPVLADLTGARWLRTDIVRATLGRGIGYGAYLAEFYPRGLESIPRVRRE